MDEIMDDRERPPRVGEEGGIDWLTAGSLGALMGVGDDALLTFLGSFGVFLRPDAEAEAMADQARMFLADYRAYLKRMGVANV